MASTCCRSGRRRRPRRRRAHGGMRRRPGAQAPVHDPQLPEPERRDVSLEKRRRLVALAERYDFLILEDDPYGLLRFEGEHLPSIESLGGHGARHLHVVASPRRWRPGLRVGYIVAPGRDRRRPRRGGLTHVHLTVTAGAGGDPPHRAERPVRAQRRTGHRSDARTPRRHGRRAPPHAAGHALHPAAGRLLPVAGTAGAALGRRSLRRRASGGRAVRQGQRLLCRPAASARCRLAYSGVSPAEIADGHGAARRRVQQALARQPMADPTPPGDGLDERQQRQLIQVGVLVVVGLLLVTFIFRNTRDVKVSFVFFTTTSSLIWVIVSSLVLGFLAGGCCLARSAIPRESEGQQAGDVDRRRTLTLEVFVQRPEPVTASMLRKDARPLSRDTRPDTRCWSSIGRAEDRLAHVSTGRRHEAEALAAVLRPRPRTSRRAGISQTSWPGATDIG